MSNCPCAGCDIRKEYARMDFHFFGEDCPYECDEYEAWKKEREARQSRMRAIIELDDVPEFQIGEIVRVYFPDSMIRSGECKPASGWISVNDRLPQDETVVVILVQHRIGWYRAFAWHDEFGWHSSAEEFVDGESDYVTHWMPLPEPPEEVSGDA